MLESLQNIDTSILLFIQDNIRSDVLNFIMIFFTRLGDSGAIWLLTGFIFFVSRKYRKAGFDIIIVIAVCWGINEILKNIVARPRPFLEIETLTVLIEHLSSWSFPSGHACASFAAAYAYTRGFKKYGGFTYIAAVLISLSRPYVGVHYMSDIIAGAAVGTVFAIIVYALSRRFVKIPNYKDMPVINQDEPGEEEDNPDDPRE